MTTDDNELCIRLTYHVVRVSERALTRIANCLGGAVRCALDMACRHESEFNPIGVADKLYLRLPSGHALRLISRTGKRVRRCPYNLRPLVAFKNSGAYDIEARLPLKSNGDNQAGPHSSLAG